MLWRYLDPSEGKIYIDGQDICKLELKDLRRSLNIITQDVKVFNSSLERNIDLLGDRLRTKEDLDRIRRILGKLGFENSEYKKKGFEMIVEDEGANLSQGEKQIVCFTRSLTKLGKLVIFDEATANIDIDTEEKFQKIVEEEYKDSTMIIVAHRI